MTRSVPALEFVTKGVVRQDRGLLPSPNPLKRIPPEHLAFQEYNDVAAELPQLLYSGKLRARLEKLAVPPVETLDGAVAIVAFRDLSFFVSAYAWADCVNDIDAPHAKTIPANLAVPFDLLAKKLNFKPILAYAMYATNNFEVVDPAKPIRFDNLRLIQHFTIPPYDRDEYGFILPHVEIEAEAGTGLCAIAHAQQAAADGDQQRYVEHVQMIAASLEEMGQTFRTIPSVCSPDVYFRHVRPWIFYFKDITYDGVGYFDHLKGETGAESPAIISFETALGVYHAPTDLRSHLAELVEYRTTRERSWIKAVTTGGSLKPFAVAHKGDSKVRDAFNAANRALGTFRRLHLEAAIQYIKQKGRGPIATGGTNYEKFLGQLVQETNDNAI